MPRNASGLFESSPATGSEDKADDMTDLQAQAAVRLLPPEYASSGRAHAANLTKAEKALKLSVVMLKRMAFGTLRSHLEGRLPGFDLTKLDLPVHATNEPTRIYASDVPQPPYFTDAPRLAPLWDRVVLVSISAGLKKGHGFMPPAEITDDDERQQWISEKLQNAWTKKPPFIDTLQAMTRDAAVIRHNKTTSPLIPRHMLNSYRSMDDTARSTFLREWFSWVKYGDSFTSISATEQERERFFPSDDASLSIMEGNKGFRAAVVFDVSPLCIDLDRNMVNYLVRVGLPWTGDMGDPSTWPEATRATLWAALFGSFDALDAYYRGDTADLPDTVTRTPNAAPFIETLQAMTRALAGAKPRIVPPDENAEAMQSTSVNDNNGERPLFPVAFGPVPVDREVQATLRAAGRLKMPRDYTRIPRWEKLVEDEIASLKQWPTSYEDTADRPALLERERQPGVREEYWPTRLSAYGEQMLAETWGDKGFIRTDAVGKYGPIERFCKNTRVGTQLVQVELSWHRQAGPLIQGWREQAERDLEEEREKIIGNRRPLLEAMGDTSDNRKLAAIDKVRSQLASYEDAQKCMEVILGQAMKQRRDVVEISAAAFRQLLWPNRPAPRNWKQEVEAILRNLMELTITVRAGGQKDVGAFLFRYRTEDDQAPQAAFNYISRGAGGHGDGIFQLRINDAFLGCMELFLDTATSPLRGGGTARLINLTRELSKDEKKRLDYVAVDAGAPFYSATAELTRPQHNLMNFIEGNITLKADPISGGAKGGRNRFQVKPMDLEARTPRAYDRSFCPLLQRGTTYVAALGHFKRSAEGGFTLYGTEKAARPDGKAGALPGGLIEKMGYPVPSGNAHARRDKILADVIDDLRRVVVTEFGGIVVGKLEAKHRADGCDEPLWLPIDQWLDDLDDKTLGHRLKVFMFLPPDWTERRKAAFEAASGYRVTEVPEQAAAAAWGEPATAALTPGEVCGPETGWRGLSLPQRLRAAMKHRGHTQTELAGMFGVTQGAISRWLAAARGETDLLIPADMAQLLVRWIETGTPPTTDELEDRAILARRPFRRPKL